MSKEVNPFVAVLEGNEPIKKQPYGSNIEYYDSMCFHLPKALVNRSFNEKEGERLVAFLESLCYDFQYCDTARSIFIRKNNGEISQEWTEVLLKNNYIWEQLGNIHGRISMYGRRTEKNVQRILIPKRKKG